MLILLSPTKTLDESLESLDEYLKSTRRFQDDTEELVAIMKKQSKANLVKLMKLSDNLASLNRKRFANFDSAISKQAALMFTGQAFQYLDIKTLSKKQHVYLQKHLRILSGLYGALRPFDSISPYRLEMGTKLATDRGKTLYNFWGSKIGELLASELGKEKFIVNVASNEYFKVVDQGVLKGTKIINMHFKQKKDGALKIVSVFAKQARGLFVRFCAESNLSKIEDLKKFDADGYQYNAAQSDELNVVFVRPQPVKGKKRKAKGQGPKKGKKRKAED